MWVICSLGKFFAFYINKIAIPYPKYQLQITNYSNFEQSEKFKQGLVEEVGTYFREILCSPMALLSFDHKLFRPFDYNY